MEPDVVAHIARSLDACYGAGLTGTGFGEYTVNPVAREKTKELSQSLAKGHQSTTDHRPEIYITCASNYAELLKQFNSLAKCEAVESREH